MKNILCIIFILFVLFGSAQTEVALDKGMANLNGKPWLIVMKINKNSYEVRDLSSNTIAVLTLIKNKDKVYFEGEFNSLETAYDIYYPAGTTVQTILESYNKNGVIVDGKIDATGLQKYCDARKIKIKRLLSAGEKQHYQDSLKRLGKRFSVSISAGIAQSFLTHPNGIRSLSYLDPWAYNAGVTYKFQSSELKGILTSNVALNFEFRTKKNVFISFGLNYSKVVYQTRNGITCYATNWYDISPKVYSDTVYNFKIREEYYFASLPIGVFYRLNRNTHFYTFGGGASLNVLFRSATVLNYGMAGQNPYQYKPTIAPPILFTKAGVFGNLGGGKALGFELEFKYYGRFEFPNPFKFFTLGGNLVFKF